MWFLILSCLLTLPAFCLAARILPQGAFGCHHRQMSRVFTIKNRMYQVCVGCGQEFEYSWALMHRVPSSVDDHTYASLNRRAEGRII